MSVNASLLRLLWTIVEEMKIQDLLTLSDTALIAVLLQRVSRQVLLTGEEVCQLYAYIGSRLLLIRDLADSRRSLGFSAIADYKTEKRSEAAIAINA